MALQPRTNPSVSALATKETAPAMGNMWMGGNAMIGRTGGGNRAGEGSVQALSCLECWGGSKGARGGGRRFGSIKCLRYDVMMCATA